ncbi:hypothetical protein L1887_03085 [Cichorium endivia]|nr:hypothetical protein L1887_03085 [Cichorium endivia]
MKQTTAVLELVIATVEKVWRFKETKAVKVWASFQKPIGFDGFLSAIDEILRGASWLKAEPKWRLME